MYHLKYRVTNRNDTICIVLPKYQYNHYIAILYRALSQSSAANMETGSHNTCLI